MNSLEEKQVKLEKEWKDEKETHRGQERKVEKLTQDVKQLREKVIVNEQYGRRKGIRILGVTENSNENCHEIIMDLVKNTLHTTLDMDEITSAHRITSRKQPRPIIAHFKTHDKKMEIMRSRKFLKGKRIIIVEDLCVELQQTLINLRKDSRISQTWSWDSKVYAKTKDGEVVQVNWGEALEETLFRQAQN